MKNIPYTYLVGWSEINLYYYGVKYGANANPDTFWKNYFTSSKDVAEYRKIHGEPDVIQVRQIFSNPQDAIDWEIKVLTRVLSENNPNRDKWINKCVHYLNYVGTPESNKVLSIAKRKYLANRTPEQIKRDYQVRLMNASNKEANRKISESQKKRFADPEYKQWYRDNVWDNPERNEKLRQNTTAKHSDPEYHAKWLEIMRSDEYRERQCSDSKKRFEDPVFKQKWIKSQAHLKEDPNYYINKSLNAKKSTGTRLATRILNSLDIDIIINISDEQYLELLEKGIDPRHKFDDNKVLKKLHDKRKKLLKDMKSKNENDVDE